MFFSHKKDRRTRGHNITLVKEQCRLDIRKNSISQRRINKWNVLSTDVSCVNLKKIYIQICQSSGLRVDGKLWDSR